MATVDYREQHLHLRCRVEPHVATAPDGSITTYGYDTLNRLNGLANSWAGSFGFSYDALSRRAQLTRPNGIPIDRRRECYLLNLAVTRKRQTRTQTY
ncbi:MAG TPA: hypothetical protein VGG14_00100 [Candidatus Sulfotelmatobacter sp.]